MAKNKEKFHMMDNYVGGLNTYQDANKLQNNELPLLQNFDFDAVGNLLPRMGGEKYGTLSQATKVVTLQALNGSSEVVISQVGSKLFLSTNLELAGGCACTSDIQNMVLFRNKVWIAPGRTNAGNVGILSYDIGANTIATYTAGVANPYNVKYITLYRDRLWASNGSRLHYSVPYMNDADNDADDWDAANNFIDIAPDDGYDIVALIATVDRLLVCKQDGSVYLVLGAYADEFQVPPGVASVNGPVSHRTVCRHRGSIYWLGKDDVYEYRGGNITPVSQRKQLYNEFTSMITTFATREQAAASVKGDDYIVSFQDAGGSTNDRTFVFDLIRRCWREYRGDNSIYFQASDVMKDGSWITGQTIVNSESKFLLVKQRAGYGDLDKASNDVKIVAKARTKEFLPGALYSVGRHKRFFLEVAYNNLLDVYFYVRPDPRDTKKDYYTHLVQLERDAATAHVWADSVASSDDKVWGDADDTIDAGELVWQSDSYFEFETKRYGIDMKGSSFALLFTTTYTTDPSIIISRWAVHYLPSRRI